MRILIADDDPISRAVLEASLRQMGHDVTAAADGQTAWEILEREGIRLVIADWMMPGKTGLELLEAIRSRGERTYVYVILLTARGEKKDIVGGLAAGADDYVIKPFERGELMFRIRAGERIIRLEEELEARNEMLHRLALTDGLTELANRRALDDTLRHLHEQARRYHRALGVAMIDIDHFKRFNDALGHEAGDKVLQQVAGLLAGAVRGADQVFRYGGEEFAGVFPETNLAGTLVVGERLRKSVEGAAIAHPANPPSDVVTVSVGVASLPPGSTLPPEALLREADQALYRAKVEGRNRTTAAEEGETPSA